MNIPKKYYIFERISFIYYPLLAYCLICGYEVLVFDFDCNMKRARLLRYLINKDVIKRIYVKTNAKEHGIVIDLVNILFEHFRHNKAIKNISNLYGSGEAGLAFKKIVLKEVFRCLYMENYLKQFSDGRGISKTCAFVPHNYLYYKTLIIRNSAYNFNALNNVRLHNYHAFLLKFIRIINNVMWCAAVAIYAAFNTAVLVLFGCKRLQKAHYKYAIAIDQEFQIKFKGKRDFSFLLDHKDITKNNTVFIISCGVDSGFLSEREKEGFKFVLIRDLFNIRNLRKNVFIPFNELKKMLISALQISFSQQDDFIFLKSAFYGIRLYLRWRAVFSKMRAQHYIYTNRDGFDQIYINVLLRQNGWKTWNYSSFIGGGLLYSNDGDYMEQRHFLWAFQNSDNYLAVNRDVIKYYKLHSQAIGQYHNIGSIYSEMVREAKEKMNGIRNCDGMFRLKFGEKSKIISFFDTSYVASPDAMTTYDDAVDFYADILRLLNENSGIFVIVKPSKKEDYFISPNQQWSFPKIGHKIIGLWDELKSHERVFWAGDRGDVPTIMALSDLVVTACMSSPTVEALGIGKRAFWYEPGEKHRGLAYDKIPGLIAHGYGELSSSVRRHLYDITDEEHSRYLEENIKGKLEPYLDGRALTRFRKLLSENVN